MPTTGWRLQQNALRGGIRNSSSRAPDSLSATFERRFGHEGPKDGKSNTLENIKEGPDAQSNIFSNTRLVGPNKHLDLSNSPLPEPRKSSRDRTLQGWSRSLKKPAPPSNTNEQPPSDIIPPTKNPYTSPPNQIHSPKTPPPTFRSILNSDAPTTTLLDSNSYANSKENIQTRAVDLAKRLKEALSQLAIGGFNKVQKSRITLAHSENMLSRDLLTTKIKKMQQTKINSRDKLFRSDLECIEDSIKNNSKYLKSGKVLKENTMLEKKRRFKFDTRGDFGGSDFECRRVRRLNDLMGINYGKFGGTGC
jgi:hypothetical protein